MEERCDFCGNAVLPFQTCGCTAGVSVRWLRTRIAELEEEVHAASRAGDKRIAELESEVERLREELEAEQLKGLIE